MFLISKWVKKVLLFEGIANIDKTEVNLTIFACSFRIICADISLVVEIKISFHPLDEFEVVLVFGFGEFLNVDVFEDFAFGKSQLENFEIVDELPFIDGVEADSLKLDFTGMHSIEDLAVNGAGSELLDFRHINFK